MKVFYITATHNSLPEDSESIAMSRIRIDIGKFFERQHAEAHMAKVSSRWRDLRVEERDETEEAQHITHGGKVGGPSQGV